MLAGERFLARGAFISQERFEEIKDYLAGDERRPNFGNGASFREAHFGPAVSFECVCIGAASDFTGARFDDLPFFEYASFGDGVTFRGAVFGRRTSFEHTTFGDGAIFFGARFDERASLYDMRFLGEATFAAAEFGRGAVFAKVRVADLLNLNRASFVAPEHLEIEAGQVAAVRLSLPEGGHLEINSPSVDLSETRFATRTVVSPPRAPSTYDDDLGRFAGDEDDHEENPHCSLPPCGEAASQKMEELPTTFPPPVIRSLRGADVQALTLSDVNLQECLFYGVHNLDRLNLAGHTSFANKSGRQALWEEVLLDNPSLARDPMDVIAPEGVATLYRALRKAREDGKDEPGAADFYWGEMEMRARALHQTSRSVQSNRPPEGADGHLPLAHGSGHNAGGVPPRGANTDKGEWRTNIARGTERTIVRLYRVVSGYGMRPSRPVFFLAVVVLLFALLFRWNGFANAYEPCQPPPTPSARLATNSAQREWVVAWAQEFGRARPADILEDFFLEKPWDKALLYSFETAASVFPLRGCPLTVWGELYRVPLRLTGVVLLGLTALAVRSKVKR